MTDQVEILSDQTEIGLGLLKDEHHILIGGHFIKFHRCLLTWLINHL